ncbi:MAG: Ig-like domain-containing protein [Oscillochloridaceae bacterium umkhey_bin13]
MQNEGYKLAMALLRPLARIWMLLLGGTLLALLLAASARAIIPFVPWLAAPTLVATIPLDGASAVLPDQVLSLQFSGPMNRVSTERALQITPAIPGELRWSTDGQTLTLLPNGGLEPALTYTLRIEPGALGRWWQPLAAPLEWRFQTAPQPVVLTALPQDEAPASTSLALIFSQPMVSAAGTLPGPLPLQSMPPLPLAARWLNPQILLLDPAEPLAPAQTYQFTLGPDLADVRGVPLGEPFTWELRTTWPQVLARSPEDQAVQVRPADPLTFTLASPLTEAQIRQALQITPPITGELALINLDNGQLVTFAPHSGWAYDTTYTIALVPPDGWSAPPPWRFRIAPQPRLVAFSPGQGQTLPADNTLRLVFSTPMDEAALRSGLSFDPPIPDLSLSVSGTEARLRPLLQAATLYTVTLAADLADQTGEPLGSAVTLRLRSAPAQPALSVPAAPARILTLDPAQPASVTLLATNLSSLDLSLYPLDQPTLLRALNLSPAEWPTFSPERYGQILARGWRTLLPPSNDPPAPFPVPVGLSDGEPLDPGAYYLRITSPEGPRADLILLVSETRLALRRGPGYALLWLTDPQGTPLADLPVALYANDQLLAEGLTDAEGSLAVSLAPDPPRPLLALSLTDNPAVARSDWRLSPAQPSSSTARSLLVLDQARYLPGDQIGVRGLMRLRLASGLIDLPTNDLACRLQLRSPAGSTISPASPCRVEPSSGVISGSFNLSPRLVPGSYSLIATLGDESLSLPFQLGAPPDLNLTLETQPLPGELRVRILEGGLPLAATAINWELDLEPLPAPILPPGFALTPLDNPVPQRLSSEAVTDGDGWLSLSLPTLNRQLRYRLAIHSADPSTDLYGSSIGLLGPNPAYAAIRLPSRLIASDQRSGLALLALDAQGRPLPGNRLRLEVFRAGSDGAPLLVRQTVAGLDGIANVQLVQLNPGVYDLVAEAGGPPTRTQLWVYGPQPSPWPSTGTTLSLIADREQYQPGDVATLLVAAPPGPGGLLLSLEQGELIEWRSRSLAEGQIIRLPITADMAPGLQVGAIVVTADRILAGEVSLLVTSPRPPLDVALELDPNEPLRPGASLPLTVSTSIAGQPVAADVIVTLAPLQPGGSPTGLERFAPGPPRSSSAAALAGAGSGPNPSLGSPSRPQPAGSAAQLSLNSGAPGLLSGQISLPEQPGSWQITAYAASGPDRVALAQSLVTTSQPVLASLLAPDRLAPGDNAQISLLISNPGSQAITVTVHASGNGLQIVPALMASPQELTLDPGSQHRLTWMVSPILGVDQASLRFQLDTPGLSETLEHPLFLIPPVSSPSTSTTLLAQGPLSVTLNLEQAAPGPLSLALAPGLQAALAYQATTLAALPNPSVEERAALVLIAAALSNQTSGDEQAAWEAQARSALEALSAVQGDDGGWGWWPNTPTTPFITGFALEAQAAAQAVLGDTRAPSLRAVAYLRRAIPGLDRPTRAYLAYALARAGYADPNDVGLARTATEADELAFLALALPANQRASLLDRLVAMAERLPAAPDERIAIRWSASVDASLPRSPTVVTAAASQALRSYRPNAVELIGAERSLLTAWQGDGWPSAYAAARVAAALLPVAATTPAEAVQLTLNNRLVLASSDPFTQTLRTQVSRVDLPATVTLNLTAATGQSLLLAYGLPRAPIPPSPLFALEQRLVDPSTNATMTSAGLRNGQLVALAQTIVVGQHVPWLELHLPLPSGLILAETPPPGPLSLLGTSPGGVLHFGAAPLSPGVYHTQVLLRVIVPGGFTAPPAVLHLPAEISGPVLAPTGLAVLIGE